MATLAAVGVAATGQLQSNPPSSATASLSPKPGVAQPQKPAAPSAPAPLPPNRALQPEEAALAIKTLSEAEDHGFPAKAFSPELAQRLLADRDAASQAKGEALLRQTLVAYAKAQHGARAMSKAIPADWGLRPAKYDAERELALALEENRLQAWLASLPPPFAGYQQLRGALKQYRDVAAAGGWPKVPDGPTLKPGMTDPRVPSLRQRIAVEDSAIDGTDANPLYDPLLAAGVERFQARQGFTPDGAVGKGTLATLNITAQGRVDEIVANLERWRWLPRTLPATRIEVNIPGGAMALYRDDHAAMTMRAIAGRPKDRTPMLISTIHSVVLNPPWNVPASIAAKELWPKQRADPGYFEREDIIVKTADDGSTRLQQRAGLKSALGQVKFDFDNHYGVYLHDTPSRAAFARDGRAVSHGCVRLEHALDLAKVLLESNDAWPPEKVDEVTAGEETIRVKLPNPTPVYLLYWTAYVDADGVLNFRSDIYDWDKALLGLLDAGARPV
ncbi:MAG: L,D-transpeptidase family protein [Caulobacteraceae bacterium]